MPLSPNKWLGSRRDVFHHPFVKFAKSSIEVVIDDDLVVLALGLAILNLVLGLRKSFLDCLFGRVTAAAQPLLQDLHAGRLDEAYSRVQTALLQLLDALHLDVEDADPLALSRGAVDALALALGHILHGLLGRAVVVAAELGVLFERVLRNHGLELVRRREVVVDPVLLAGAGLASRVRDAEPKQLRVVREQPLDECRLARARRAGEDYRSHLGGGRGSRRHGEGSVVEILHVYVRGDGEGVVSGFASRPCKEQSCPRPHQE